MNLEKKISIKLGNIRLKIDGILVMEEAFGDT